ncbi:MAG TPA: serine/threonine-protein kinase [Terriglobales bacterium]|nr:serine/threonine-protein kinase [Terriglobales bacterium]
MAATIEKVGRYEIVSELGRGAMGLVYRAVDPNIGRTVALKTMRVDVHGLEHDDMLRRFRNEAKSAGVMNHPNIVTIYDADESDGLFYIAMEFLEGDTLQSRIIERRVLPVEEIITIAKQVCAGLDYAHARNVIHRDIKPANIMITRQNVAKIMDFGISKCAGNMTSSGQVLGTPNYMSPEQVRGDEIDGRSDLFSFGVVLYEMATGERPFMGDNVTTIIYKIVNDLPIPASERETTVHPGLSAVIARCLAKDRNERYQSGAELVADIENYRAYGSEEERTTVLRSRPSSGSTQRARVGSLANRQMTAGSRSSRVSVSTAAATQMATIPMNRASSSSHGVKGATGGAPAASSPNKKTGKTVGFAIGALVVSLVVLGGLKNRRVHARLERSQQVVHTETQPVTVPAPATVEQQTAPTPQTQIPPEIDEAKTEEQQPSRPRPAVISHPVERAEKAVSDGKIDVRFTSNPEGAFVQFDGKLSAAWVTPFTLPNITPGTHEVVFTKDGYSPETKDLQLGSHNSSYNVDLAAITTAIAVSSTPPGASIEIDGEDTGQVTPAQIPVGEGDHRVVVRLDGYHSAQTIAHVDRGQIFNFPPVLNPSDAHQAGYASGLATRFGKVWGGGIPSGKGMVDFRTNPPGAQILVEGRLLKVATPAHTPFPPGNFRIQLREPGYKPYNRTIHVDEGKLLTVDVSLQSQ